MNIGEVKVGRTGTALKALLGSCVGIAFYWPAKHRAALAHCLLPLAPAITNTISAKYVSQAIPSLLALLKIRPGDVDQIEVSLAGGGNMLAQLAQSNPQHIGIQNYQLAQKLLLERGFKIKNLDIGGNSGREIRLDCGTGEVGIVKLAKAA